MIEQAYLLLLAAALGFGGKLLWDKLNSHGKDIMTDDKCKEMQLKCGISEFKLKYDLHREEVVRHTAKIDEQLSNMENAMKTNARDVKEDVKGLREDIKGIKEQIITLITTLNGGKKDKDK